MNDFLARRKQGLGASDIAAILGLNPYRTPVDVFLDKIGATDNSDSLRLRFGREAEEFVAQEYAKITGQKVVRHNALLKHHDFPNVIGNIDRLVVTNGKVAAHQGQIRTWLGLECKTVGGWAFQQGDWGEAGSDKVPFPYLIQCLTYMELTGCKQWDLAALVGAGERLAIYHIPANPELARKLCAKAQDFWDNHIAKRIPPDPTCSADVDKFFPTAEKEQKYASDFDCANVLRLKGIREQEKKLSEEKETLHMHLKSSMGTANELIDPDGKKLATWNNRKGRSMFDLRTMLAYQNPGALDEEIDLLCYSASEQFTKQSPSGRTLLIK